MTATRRSLVGHRDFRLIWAGQGVSDIGTAVSVVVIPLVAVVYLEASPIEVGVLSAVEWLPWLLIGLPAGVWVDRSRRLRLMVMCDLVRAALLASVPLAAAFGALTIGQLFAAAFGTGLATVLFQVAYQSYLPVLLERDDLAEGNAKLQGTQAVASIIGPGLGGLLAQLLRAPFALLADAASYLVSLLALVRIKAREDDPAPSGNRSVRVEIAEGTRYVWHDPLLRVMTIGPAIGNLFFIGYEAIVVVFLVRTVHVTASTVGVLMAAGGVGGVLGAAVARPLGRRIGTARTMWFAMLLTSPFGLLIPLTSRGPGLILFVLGNMIVLAGILVYNVTILTFRQNYCPPRMLGRVVATMRFVLFGTMPLGSLLAGALAQTLGNRTALWLVLLGNIVPVFVFGASPVRRIRDLPERPA